jgi:hypothetical protein
VALAAAIAGIGLYFSRPDSPWCADSGDVNTDVDCPAEVRYDDRMYVAECIEPATPVEIDERVRVRYHDGDSATDRVAWTIRGIPAEQVILLEETDDVACAGSELAYGQDISGADAIEMLAAQPASD